MNNTFLARRIAGPGMASEYYYQVRPEQALVALETRLEHAELNAYENQISQKILEPTSSCYSFLKRMFQPFGVMPSRKTVGPVMQLETESEELLSKLREKLKERRDGLQSNLTGDITARVSDWLIQSRPRGSLQFTLTDTKNAAKINRIFHGRTFTS